MMDIGAMDTAGAAVAWNGVINNGGDANVATMSAAFPITIPTDVINHIMTYAASAEKCHGCLRRPKNAFPIRQGKFSYCSQACYNFI